MSVCTGLPVCAARRAIAAVSTVAVDATGTLTGFGGDEKNRVHALLSACPAPAMIIGGK